MVQPRGTAWWLAALMTLAALASHATAQGSEGNTPSCGSKLTTCVNYINSNSTPPATCCDPLKVAVTEERECLCNIYNNTDFLKSFHINITQALSLPKRCHISTGKSDNICQAGGGPETGSKSGSCRLPIAGLIPSFLFYFTYNLLFC